MPFPGSPDRYPARDEVVSYLRGYAEAFGLPVLAGKRVLRAERAQAPGVPPADRRRRGVPGPDPDRRHGLLRQPHRPRFPGQERFDACVLHAAEYRNPVLFRGKRVVVVGAGNSAVQIAHELVEVAETTLATRAPIRFSPPARPRAGPPLLALRLRPRPPPARAPLRRLEPGGVVDDGTYAAAMRSGRPDRRPVFSRFTESGVVWDDGREEPVDAVLLATGYGPNLGYLGPLGALRADGRPDQRGGEPHRPRALLRRAALPDLLRLGDPARVGSDAELVVARARRQVARSAMEPAGHPASVTPPRRVRAVGPSFGGKRCCGVTFP